MKEQFSFNIKNTRTGHIWLLTNLILLLVAICLFYWGIKTNITGTKFLGGLTAFLVMLDLIIKERKWDIHKGVIIVTVIGFFQIKLWWLGIGVYCLSLFAQMAASNKKIRLTADKITIKPSFFTTFEWLQLQNVVLKDGLLTLDFKNNKLLQTPIMDELNEAETKQFNDFCNEQLKANRQ